MENVSFNIEQIMSMLPHRYPMLLVDRVLSCSAGEKIIALKNVSINEDFFNGHFPGHPIMPGVLIVEAMAQAAGVLVLQSIDQQEWGELLVYFMSIDNAKFRQPVVPGDQLIFVVEVLQSRGKVWKLKGEALVNEAKVAEAVFTAMIVEK